MSLKLIAKLLIVKSVLLYFSFLYVAYCWTITWVASLLMFLNFPKTFSTLLSYSIHFVISIKIGNRCVDYVLKASDLEKNLENVSIVDMRTGEDVKATRKTRVDLEPIYLRIDDIKKIIHYTHFIPVGRGFSQQLIDTNFPGWAWNQVCSVVMRSKAFELDKGAPIFKDNFEGILIYPNGKFTLDFGDLECPQKENYVPMRNREAN